MNPVVITGASGAMGSAAVKMMAEKGYPVIMACRNVEKGEACKAKILVDLPDADLRVLPLDLSRLASVKAFAQNLSEEGVTLAGLFNNAGIMNRKYSVTEDGLENTLQVNFISPAMLSRWLLPLMELEGNIVNMVSLTCRIAKIDEHLLELKEKDFGQLNTYGKSKLALLLFTIALARHTDIHVNMADPGVVNSNMIHMSRWFDPLADALFRPFCKSPEQGARPAVNALRSSETQHLFNGSKCREVPKKFLSNPLIDWTWKTVDELFCRFD